MSTLTGLESPPLEEERNPGSDKPTGGESDGACMFCDDNLGLRSSGEDALAFIDHLQESAECRREYQLWKQVITDEWHGD